MQTNPAVLFTQKKVGFTTKSAPRKIKVTDKFPVQTKPHWRFPKYKLKLTRTLGTCGNLETDNRHMWGSHYNPQVSWAETTLPSLSVTIWHRRAGVRSSSRRAADESQVFVTREAQKTNNIISTPLPELNSRPCLFLTHYFILFIIWKWIMLYFEKLPLWPLWYRWSRWSIHLLCEGSTQARTTQQRGCRSQLQVRECVCGVGLSLSSGPSKEFFSLWAQGLNIT